MKEGGRSIHEVVNAGDVVACKEEMFSEDRTNVAGTSGYKYLDGGCLATWHNNTFID